MVGRVWVMGIWQDWRKTAGRGKIGAVDGWFLTGVRRRFGGRIQEGRRVKMFALGMGLSRWWLGMGWRSSVWRNNF